MNKYESCINLKLELATSKNLLATSKNQASCSMRLQTQPRCPFPSLLLLRSSTLLHLAQSRKAALCVYSVAALVIRSPLQQIRKAPIFA